MTSLRERANQPCLVVRAKTKLKNGFTTAAEGAIGYVGNGAYYRAKWNGKLYINTALFPKTRGNKWAPMGLSNYPAEESVEIIDEIDEMPDFVYLGKYIYMLTEDWKNKVNYLGQNDK